MSPVYVKRKDIASFILKHKKPVLINVLWCGEAVNNQTGAVRMPTTEERNNAIEKRRGHVITLVGYYSKSKQFIFRNSYGPTWGKQGYGIIPEKYVINHCEVCPKLKNINNMPDEMRQFMLKAATGVSGKLILNTSK